MMPAIAATGPSPQKAAFFKGCAAGFEFLAAFYELTAEQQEELIQNIQVMQTTTKQEAKRGKRNG